MDGFIPGAFVCSNDLYFETNRRHITGHIIRPTTHIGDDMVIVRWVTQEGENLNPALDRQMVLMHKKYLKIK